MSDHSLMNPAFLRKELSDATDMHAKDQMTENELRIRVIDHGVMVAKAELANGEGQPLVLTPEQAKETYHLINDLMNQVVVLTVKQNVLTNQYKQLLKDRRYRIATRITNFFK